MNTNEIKSLRESRSAAHAKAITILSKQGEISGDDKIVFERCMAEVDKLTAQITVAEGIARNENPAYTAARLRENAEASTPEQHMRAASFRRFMQFGKSELTSQDRLLLQRETRAVAEGSQLLHLGTYSGLGYFIPTGFRNQIEEATKWFAPLTEDGVFTILSTDTGNVIPMPTNNDTGNAATIVGEAASVSEVDTTASQIPLSAYKFTSGEIIASMELLQDSTFDLEPWFAKKFGERFGRAYENYLTNGSGSSQPTGLLTAIAASGATSIIATGSSANDGTSATGANSIGYADLVNLEHSVDPSYRRGAKYMFHDTTLSLIKKILDKYGRPLWVAGIGVGEPDTINGYPYVINQSMPQVGSVSEAVTMVFGDLTKFIVRKVKPMTMIRLDEKYAEQGQVAFLAFSRIDSNLLDAGTHPINTLTQHS